MDKKNTVIGILLIVAAILSLYISERYAPPKANPAAVRAAAGPPAPPGASEPALVSGAPAPATFASAAAERSGAVVTTLENDFIRVHFTDFGGAIRDVALVAKTRQGTLLYPAARGGYEPFVFNQLHADPILALTNYPGLDTGTRYQLVSKTDTAVVYRAVIAGQLELTRRYTLSPDQVGSTDPYQLRAETTFRNLGAKATAPVQLTMSVGTAAPVNTEDRGTLLVTGYSDGKSQTFYMRSKLEASGGIFGLNAHPALPDLESPGPVAWATVSNQFFASILTPDQPAAGLVTRRVKLLKELPDEDRSAYGVTDSVNLNLGPIAPGSHTTLGASLYVGPKEYHRLANSDVFKADQDKVMQFGTFKFFSEILLTLMTWIHHVVPNWGLDIVFTTLTLKILFVPFTLAASRSAKRMQKLQPELKVINEKYKDNPQKKNTATMELFKQHKVNPMGGCLPILVTLPFFFGFFRMLMSTAELRFAPFLWAHDLSAPDTVGHILGIAINPLPLMLAVTSFIQMRVTPQPTVDNAQAKMMMFTPLIFLFICYTYSCALSLYSTTNGLFTILQQLIINRTKDAPPDPVPARATPGGRPVKNVTPGRKK